MAWNARAGEYDGDFEQMHYTPIDESHPKARNNQKGKKPLMSLEQQEAEYLRKKHEKERMKAVSSAIYKLTPLGSLLSLLPMDAVVGKLLVYGMHLLLFTPSPHSLILSSFLPSFLSVSLSLFFIAALFGCFDPVLTVAALMTVKSPFLSSLEKREESKEAQARFEASFSDHLTMANVFTKWQQAVADGLSWEFCAAVCYESLFPSNPIFHLHSPLLHY